MTSKSFTPAAPMYPDVEVQLTGHDGNAFAVIGAVSRALRREVSADAAKRFAAEAMNCGTFRALLRFAASTVRVS